MGGSVTEMWGNAAMQGTTMRSGAPANATAMNRARVRSTSTTLADAIENARDAVVGVADAS